MRTPLRPFRTARPGPTTIFMFDRAVKIFCEIRCGWNCSTKENRSRGPAVAEGRERSYRSSVGKGSQVICPVLRRFSLCAARYKEYRFPRSDDGGNRRKPSGAERPVILFIPNTVTIIVSGSRRERKCLFPPRTPLAIALIPTAKRARRSALEDALF